MTHVLTPTLFRAPLCCLFIAAVLMSGCESTPPIEHTGMGVIRSIDWYQRSFVHETTGGFVKYVNTCGEMPVWEGMVADISLQWDHGDFRHCFRVVGVQRARQ